MHVTFLWIAVGFGLTAFVVHTFVGGRFVARPLLADRSLPPASKWLNYFCWHVTTALLAAVTVAMAWAAFDERLMPVVAFTGVFAVISSVLSAAVALKARINPLRFPSTSLLAGTGIFALAAVLA